MDEDDEDIVFRRHRFHHADTDEEDSVSISTLAHAIDTDKPLNSLAPIIAIRTQSLKAMPIVSHQMNTIHPTNLSIPIEAIQFTQMIVET